ncbi:MAG: glycine--tRNA ligase subunit beta, partial [Alphaproteobacteria bacterium]|nr:glycine--tRNA ligase subunit beta [Alphaproteobacteria bacterium]
MPDLLLEILSEEIPARMQEQAAHDLERLVVGMLSESGLLFEGARRFSGPRRLAVAIKSLPAKQPDVTEEKKGPRTNAPAKAIEGFLRSTGLSLGDCEKRNDGKGEYLVAVVARQGRAVSEVLRDGLPQALARLAWPKSMRWPAGGLARWVRPLHSIACVFDAEPVVFTFAGVTSGGTTAGHRYLSSGPIVLRKIDEYESRLKNACVLADASDRKEAILHDARQQAFALGLNLVEDPRLLDEVSGLVEWPVVLVGNIAEEFMELPPEILRTSMRSHQKYFSLRNADSGSLSNRFVVVANMVTADGGKEIVRGNERVLRARLADAKFFWDLDRKTRL